MEAMRKGHFQPNPPEGSFQMVEEVVVRNKPGWAGFSINRPVSYWLRKQFETIFLLRQGNELGFSGSSRVVL